MKNLMICLRKMGAGPQSAIVKIGACFFDIETGKIDKGFEYRINLKDTLSDREFDSPMLECWLNQSKEAQQKILTESPSLFEGLKEFSHFVISNIEEDSNTEEYESININVWGYTSYYECAILEAFNNFIEHYAKRRINLNKNCWQTIVNMAKSITAMDDENCRPLSVENEHSALVVALDQTKCVSDAYQALKNSH